MIQFKALLCILWVCSIGVSGSRPWSTGGEKRPLLQNLSDGKSQIPLLHAPLEARPLQDIEEQVCGSSWCVH